MARPSRADAQRARVLAASVEIFGTRGYRATSMNEIAAGVGLSKPTLYHYFRNKEELLVRIYSDVLDESLRMAQETVAAAATPFDGLHDLLVSRVVLHLREPGAAQDLLRGGGRAAARALRGSDRAPAPVRGRRPSPRCGATSTQHPEVRPAMAPKVFVNMCLGAVNWTYKWYRPTGPRTPAELGPEMADALLAVLVPPS